MENFNARKTFLRAIDAVQAANRLRSSNQPNTERFSSDFEEIKDNEESNVTRENIENPEPKKRQLHAVI